MINSEKWASYTQNLKLGFVHTKMSSAYREKILKNRAYIRNLNDIVLYLGQQRLAFRVLHYAMKKKHQLAKVCNFRFSLTDLKLYL